MASDEFDPVVRRRKSRDLRRSRDISDESSDRDTRRRSSTDGALLGAEAPRLLPGISNMRLVGLSCLVFMPYTRACARDAMPPPSPSPRRPPRLRHAVPSLLPAPAHAPPPPPPRAQPRFPTLCTVLLVLTLNIPKEQRSAALENTVVGVGLLLLLTAMGTVAAAILARSRS
jgi:hypothetical protein